MQGTYETLAEVARQKFNSSLKGTITLTAGLGGMGGAQPLAVTMNEGVCIAIEIDPKKIERRIETGYLDVSCNKLYEAINLANNAKNSHKPLSFGLLCNVDDLLPELIVINFIPEIVTDHTSAHDVLNGYNLLL